MFPFYLCILTVLFTLLLPDNALAVQQHGGAEGLISHQIGHVLFITGMLILFYRLKGSRSRGTGWFEFKIFIGLIILWNLLTFYGHWHRELISPDKFVQLKGHVTGFSISSLTDAFFYLSRLDHLLLVPAFLFLLIALNKWRKQA
jgi:hypothetical protein